MAVVRVENPVWDFEVFSEQSCPEHPGVHLAHLGPRAGPVKKTCMGEDIMGFLLLSSEGFPFQSALMEGQGRIV